MSRLALKQYSFKKCPFCGEIDIQIMLFQTIDVGFIEDKEDLHYLAYASCQNTNCKAKGPQVIGPYLDSVLKKAGELWNG